MPSLMATLGLDPAPFKAGLDNAVESARSAGGRIMSSLGNDISKSTVVNPRAPRSMASDYTNWWSQSLLDRDVEAASRSNQARRLMRQRHADQERADAAVAQERLDGEIEAASRRNMARRLMRERAEKRAAREAEAQESSVFNRVGQYAVGAVGAYIGFQAIDSAVRGTVQYADDIDELSDRVGVGVEQLQRWDYALTLNGSSLESLTKVLEKMAVTRQKALGGDEKAIATYERLGVTMDQLRSKTSNEELLRGPIGEKIRVANPEDIIADFREIGGKGAGELVIAFRNGLQDAMSEASVITDETTAKLGELADKLKGYWYDVRATIAEVLGGIVGYMEGQWRQSSTIAAGIRGFFGFGEGGGWGVKGATAEMDAYAKSVAEQDEKAKKNRELKKNLARGEHEEEEGKKAREAREKSEEYIARLKEDTFKKQQERDYAAMTTAQRIAELTRRENEINRTIGFYDPATQIEMEGELADIGKKKLGEEDKLKREQEQEEKKQEMEQARRQKASAWRSPEVNSLQRIGAYVSPELAGLADSTKQSLGHLQAIRTHLENLDKNARDTKF